MKLFLSLLLGVCLLVPAQSFSQDLKQVSIGPYLGYRAGVSTVVTPQGRKNGVGFNNIPEFGLTSYFPLTSQANIGIATELGYSTYSYLMISGRQDATEYKLSHSYLTINPNFFFRGFFIGVNIGLPMASDYDGTEIKTSKQETIAELKVGGMIPIYQDESGELNLVIMGGYFLSGIYKDFVKNDPMKDILLTDEPVTKIFNPRPASLMVGFNFLFNLSKSQEEVFDE
jgi:hypothetical protein